MPVVSCICQQVQSLDNQNGFGVFGKSIRDSKMYIEECIPLEMERIARPRAMSYEALNGVIVITTKNHK